MKRRLYFLCVLLMPATLTASSLRVHQTEDPFTSTRILTTAPLVLSQSRFHSGRSAYMALVLERTQRPEAGPQFHMKIYCGSSKRRPLEVPAGNSLVTVVDGRARSYYSAGTAATHAAPGAREAIQPHVMYEDIPAEDWDALAQAKSIHLQVAGPAGTIAADLDAHERATLRQFVIRYVDSPSQN